MYTVTYMRTPWSQEYETEPDSSYILTRYPGPTIRHRHYILDCGTTDSIDTFIEGALPGVYDFKKHDEITRVIIGSPHLHHAAFPTR